MTHPTTSRPDFRPAWWLRGRHAQTMWGKLFRRLPSLPTRVERWETPDGDFVVLHRLDARPAGRGGPRLLVLHGLEGSARSHYAVGMLDEARRRGWAADVLVFRSCGGEMNRLARPYPPGGNGGPDFLVR